MHTRFSALALALMLALTVPLDGEAGRDYAAMLQTSLERVNWEFPRDYAFTEIAVEDEIERSARFDPGRPEGQRWTLLTVDGRAPTAEEQAVFADERGDYEIDMGRDGDGGLSELVRLDTVELKEETDSYYVLGFRPAFDADDEEEAKIFRRMHGEARVTRRDGRLDTLTISNSRAIRPVPGAKISKMIMHFGFEPVAEGSVLSDIDIQVKGSALMFVRFNEREHIRYRDFERVSAR